MSAIGDYIHLTYAGYAGFRGTPGPYLRNADMVIKKHKKIFDDDINKMESKLTPKLQEEINQNLQLINSLQEQYQGSKEYPEVSAVLQALLENFAEGMSDKWFRQDALEAAANGLLSGEAAAISAAPTVSKESLTDIQTQLVQNANIKLGEMIQETLNSIASLLQKGQVSEKEIQAQIKQSTIKKEAFLQWLSQQNRTVAEKDPVIEANIQSIFNNLKETMTKENSVERKNVQSLINSLIHSISVYKKYTDWKGEGGEAFTYAAVKGALASAFKSVADVEVIGTTGRSLSGIDTTLFSEIFKDQYSMLLGGKGDNAKFEYGDFVAATDLTKADKIDVVLRMKNQSNVGISVKNYSDETIMKKGIENSVSNLLTLLQNENDDDFINHYINLSSIKENGGYVFNNNFAREAAYKLIRQILITKLLTGYNTSSGLGGQTQDTAKLLIRYNAKGVGLSNGKAGASVEIYNMKDILRKGLFARNRYNIKGFPEFLLGNNKQSSPEIRIHQIISSLAIPIRHSVTLSDLQVS